MGEVINFPDQRVDYFGGCPHCRKNDGYLNIGRTHIYVCRKHKVRWDVGSNLFSSWKYETEEDWKRNAEKIAHYEDVEPICWTPPPGYEEYLKELEAMDFNF